MRAGSRVAPSEFQALELRAHELLADVPLHDVWHLALPGGGAGRTVADVLALMSAQRIAAINPAVRALFGLRALLGRIFGWDEPRAPVPSAIPPQSLIHSLSEAERSQSTVEPGTADGPFRVVYVYPDEALSEISNATVHAFSVVAMQPAAAGYDVYWAIYVKPVGRITAFYMALIDPFRRFIVYPAILRHIRSAWCDEHAA